MRRSLRLLFLIATPFFIYDAGIKLGIIPPCHSSYYHIFKNVIFMYILAGIAALAKVLYLSFTFNDCNEAAFELKQDVKDARKELTKGGFKFN